MPTIPTYQRQKQNSINANAPKQNINTPAAAFGANTGRALEQAGSQMGQLSDLMVKRQLELRDKANQAWADDKFTDLAGWADDYGYNPETGAYQKKGQAADGITKQAAQDYDKYIEELIADAPNPEAAQRLRSKAQGLRRSDLRGFARHQSTELTNWEISASEGVAEVTTNWIHRNWSVEPEKLEEKFDNEVLPEIEKVATLKGVDAAAAKEKARANAFGPVIAQHIAKGATQKAGALLERWGGGLTEDQRARLTLAIRKKDIEMAADSTAMSLVDEDVTWEQAQSKINSISDPDLKKATRSMYNTYRTAKVRSDTETTQKLVVDAVDKIHSQEGDLVEQQKFYDSLPEDTKQQREVKKQAGRVLKSYKSARGVDFMSDPQAWENAGDDIYYGTITTEQELRAKYGAELTKSDMDNRVRDLKDSQTFKNFHTAADTAFRKAIGKVDKDLSDSDKRAKKAFEIYAREQALETNKASDPAYLQQLADGFVLSGETKGWEPGHGPDKRFYQAINDPTWAPDVIEDDQKVNDFQLTRSMVDGLKSQAPAQAPAKWKDCLDAAEGDPELAARYFWRDYIHKNKLGKRGTK